MESKYMKTSKKSEAISAAKSIKGKVIYLRPDAYRSDLLAALNYYNENYSDSDKKAWLIDYSKKFDKKLAQGMSKVSEEHFRHAGILARLIDSGSELEVAEQTHLSRKIQEIVSLIPTKVDTPDTPVTNVVNIQDRITNIARKHAGEFDNEIDIFITNKKNDFSAKNYLLSNEISSPIAKRIGSFYVHQAQELRDAIDGTDEQLVEGYSHLTKSELKKLATFIESIIDDCRGQMKSNKANRAPKKRKEKPASVLVSKLKYKREDVEYGIKSEPAPTVINSQELWIFNTKTRSLQVYRAAGSAGLSIKGSTLIGYDPENSGGRKLRKPELVKGYTSLTKRPLGTIYKDLTTKEQEVTGRINNDCILLKVFQ